MASQIEKDSVGSVRGGNLRPEIITIIAGQNYRDMTSEETKAHVAWLKQSIRIEGVKDPIDVIFSDGKWFLAPGGGECRLTACKELRKEKWDGYIPCFQVKGDEVYLLKRSILRNTGLAPTLLELGKALQQLIDLKQPLEEVVKCVPPSITTDPAKAMRVGEEGSGPKRGSHCGQEGRKGGHRWGEGKRGSSGSRGEEEPPHGRREPRYSGF